MQARTYTGTQLGNLAFPLGGIGAGMFCLEGSGGISQLSLRHKPDLKNEPQAYSAISIKGAKPLARVLEGPVPMRKAWNQPWAGNGLAEHTYGLPRFSNATFSSRFPFARIALSDPALPLSVELTAWSPFVPGDADASSLPLAGFEFRFKNVTGAKVEAVYSFHARNLMVTEAGKKVPGSAKVRPLSGGFLLRQDALPGLPHEEGSFSVHVQGAATNVRPWFRGGWWDAMTMAWKSVEEGASSEEAFPGEGEAAPGASLYVPLSLEAGETKELRLLFAWHVPFSEQRHGDDPEGVEKPKAGEGNYRPWYAGKFEDIAALNQHWAAQYSDLRARTKAFTDCFYDSTLPAEVLEAVAANLSILKSPTVMRQMDGRFWAWEGTGDDNGSCHGTCTHVWNYAQAVPHLFPALERSLRETEFLVSQDASGHQMFRSNLPIREPKHYFHAAADGQLGGIMKAHRDWRISGDSAWLEELWPSLVKSLDYCIEAWDPGHKGILEEPHHNTYDIEFWGPDGMCTSFYLGALRAAVVMGQALKKDVAPYQAIFDKGRQYLESQLFNGEYFEQKVQRKGLRAKDPVETSGAWNVNYSKEAVALLESEGPKYQYGKGCLADGILGAWIGAMCGLDDFLDGGKVQSHLLAVHKYNLKKDLSTHANPQRPTYALGKDGGLLLCSWPKGGRLSLPFPYSDEVWTGIEYQVASHLMLYGHVDKGLEIVRILRQRYDGTTRNPFDEIECGHWYARALASYGMLASLSGARYDAVDKVLYLQPRVKGDFKAFLSVDGAYGQVGVKEGKPFFNVVSGKVDVKRIDYRAFA